MCSSLNRMLSSTHKETPYKLKNTVLQSRNTVQQVFCLHLVGSNVKYTQVLKVCFYLLSIFPLQVFVPRLNLWIIPLSSNFIEVIVPVFHTQHIFCHVSCDDHENVAKWASRMTRKRKVTQHFTKQLPPCVVKILFFHPVFLWLVTTLSSLQQSPCNVLKE